MMRFLLKGLLRDRSRSLFPVLIVAAGVVLTVLMHAWMNGALMLMLQSTAHYSTGHVRVMTKAYAAESGQAPNDLALLGIDSLLSALKGRFPDLLWTPRITFGGLLDVPDEQGETRAQSPVFGTAADFLSPQSPEAGILNIQNSIVRGRALQNLGDILIADALAERLGVQPGETVTLMSTTMHGGMTLANFTIAGTVRFGVAAMDRGAVLADLSGIQQALDMQDGAGEILGFFPDDVYHEDRADDVVSQFNEDEGNLQHDAFAPVMGTLRYESGLDDYLDVIGSFSGIFVGIFVLAMSVVLWNTGLTGNLRRYGEMGLRLAVGEEKGHLYRSIVAESLAIGFIGSLLGTAIGVAIAYYLQIYGIDVGSMMKGSAMMIPNVMRAQVTPFSFVIGFLPGMLATFLGSAISGMAIYKRQTAQLFKELET